MAQSFIFYGANEIQNYKNAKELACQYLMQNSALEKDKLAIHIENETYPNLLVIKKIDDSNDISIEQSRNVIEFLSQKPLIQGNSVVMIDSAEYLSKNSANCLLKILEEPPKDSILILTCKKLMSIIPTIRSRCVKFKVENKQNYNIDDFGDFNLYAANLLHMDSDNLLLKKSVEFISNGMKNIADFAKSIKPDEFDIFCEICVLYSYFKFSKSSIDHKKKLAQIVLEIQNLIIVSQNTHPDKHNLITAISLIFSCL